MTDDLTVAMLASLIFRAFAVLPTRMRERHRVVVRLFPSTAEAVIFGQFVLSISIVAIRTSPGVESHQASSSLLGVCQLILIDRVLLVFRAVWSLPVNALVVFSFFLLVVGDALL